MIKTPPSSPIWTNHFESPSRSLPNPSELFKMDKIDSPFKRQKISFELEPPKKPTKKKVSKIIPGLPVLDDLQMDMKIDICKNIGSGSFGNVYQIRLKDHLGKPKSPYFAMKIILPGERTCHKDLIAEASNFCKDGCIPGFAMSKSDGTYLGFSPIAEPLSQKIIHSGNIEKILKLMHEAIMNAQIQVVNDVNMQNMGYISKGTPTIVLDENGFPCEGPPISRDIVRIIDLGECEAPEDANPLYTALIPVENMIEQDDINKFRKFKFEMMDALLRNKILPISQQVSHEIIVSEICKKYEYQYAKGEI
jgi:hypothetical protein